MYLYYCILIGASVLGICSTEYASNHALSSQSYDRGDVPLSYKYNFIHVYTTPRPRHSPNHYPNLKYQYKNIPQQFPQLANNQNIQYAPLPLRIQEQYSNAVFIPQEEIKKPELYTEAHTAANDIENYDEMDLKKEQQEKRNLVPYIDSVERSNARSRKYVPGYNVDLEAVNSKLTQNGLYAINPNFLVKNKQVNVNFLQPQVSKRKQNDRQRLPQNNEANEKRAYSELSHQNPLKVKKYNENNFPKEKLKENRPFFYVKAPTVELNHARAHHIARAMHKASMNVNSSFRKLPSLPQEYFSESKSLQPSNTQLYPVQKDNAHMIRHNS